MIKTGIIFNHIYRLKFPAQAQWRNQPQQRGQWDTQRGRRGNRRHFPQGQYIKIHRQVDFIHRLNKRGKLRQRLTALQIFHNQHLALLRFIPQRLRVSRATDAKAGVMKFALLGVAKLRQLTKRGTRRGPLGKTQIQMSIEIHDPNPLAGKSIKNSRTVTEGRFMPSTEHKSAHSGALALRDGFA